MTPLKWTLLFALLLPGAPTLTGGESSPQEQPPKAERKPDKLMKRKLDHAQKILEGLALNDFEKLARNAEELVLISQLAEWRAVKTPAYDVQSGDFRRHAQSVIKHAKAKNSDETAKAYVEMTMSCVKCHKYIREVRMTHLGAAEWGALTE